MEITQLEATRRLAQVGVHRPSAVRLLRAGFAGPARRVGGTQRAARLLYSTAAVDELGARPLVSAREPANPLAPATLVLRSHLRQEDVTSSSGRTGRGSTGCGWTGVDLLADPVEQRAALSVTRRLGGGSWVVAVLALRRWGSIPLVATLEGFVAHCAEIVDFTTAPDGRTQMTLQDAGSWATDVESIRVEAGLGAERRWLVVPGVSAARRAVG